MPPKEEYGLASDTISSIYWKEAFDTTFSSGIQFNLSTLGKAREH